MDDCSTVWSIPDPLWGRKWPEMAGNGRKWPEMSITSGFILHSSGGPPAPDIDFRTNIVKRTSIPNKK